jgi:hypothetical protein
MSQTTSPTTVQLTRSRATAVRDTLLAARKFLLEHPEECKLIPAARRQESNPKGAGAPHIHGSSECISQFLGPKNYPGPTVREYTGITDDVIEHVVTKGSTHPERQDKIPLKAAVAISQLPTKEVRQAAVAAVGRNIQNWRLRHFYFQVPCQQCEG